MGKAKEYRVVNNRMLFRCPECGAKRNSAVHNVRKKSIRCHKCEVIAKCLFNRRINQREFQSGKALLITRGGKELEVSLFDISLSGVGFELPLGVSYARLLTIGQEVQLRCNWNARLFPHGRFIVQSIKGRRIGVKKIA